MGRLDGKTAIVTGGATGLGRAIAILYAEEGARVVVADIAQSDVVDEIVGAGGQAVFALTDVTSASDLADAVALAEERFGGLHIMTANAGIMGSATGKRLIDVSEQELEAVFAVNFHGVWRAFAAALPAVERAGGGALTATTSLAAHVGMSGLSAYAASKAAVVALVRCVAAEAADGVRVNAVSPGAIATEMAATAATSSAPSAARSARPMAHPRQIAAAHLFLASDEASFVTGQTIVADGGRSAFEARAR